MSNQSDADKEKMWDLLKEAISELCEEGSPLIPIPAGMFLTAMIALEENKGLYSSEEMASKILKRGPDGKISVPDLQPPDTIKCELCNNDFYPNGEPDIYAVQEEYKELFPEEKKIVPPALCCEDCYNELVGTIDPKKWREKWQNAIAKGWYQIKSKKIETPSEQAETLKKKRKKNKIIPDLTNGYYNEPDDKDTDYEKYNSKRNVNKAFDFVKKFLDDD